MLRKGRAVWPALFRALRDTPDERVRVWTALRAPAGKAGAGRRRNFQVFSEQPCQGLTRPAARRGVAFARAKAVMGRRGRGLARLSPRGPPMTYRLEPFADVGLDEALLKVVVADHQRALPRLDKLWTYYRNALQPAGMGGSAAGGAGGSLASGW